MIATLEYYSDKWGWVLRRPCGDVVYSGIYMVSDQNAENLIKYADDRGIILVPDDPASHQDD